MTRLVRIEPATPATTKKLRCAVYTRKSTDEGSEKEFNSLDAQREGIAGVGMLCKTGVTGRAGVAQG